MSGTSSRQRRSTTTAVFFNVGDDVFAYCDEDRNW
jgi:hypothetical protein